MSERASEAKQRPDSLRCAFLTLLVLGACGKPMWRSPLPTLSDQPLPPGQPVEAGIFALLVPAEEKAVLLAESTLVVGTGRNDPPILDPGDSYLVPGRWPDSVKAGFAAAFADYNQGGRRPHPVSRLALAHPQVQFARPSSVDCMAKRTPDCDWISSLVWLSPVGFNADSTYAVAYRQTWCGGGLCGEGAVFMFRRQPENLWILWSARSLWIS